MPHFCEATSPGESQEAAAKEALSSEEKLAEVPELPFDGVVRIELRVIVEMYGLETPFDNDEIWPEGQVADRMNVAREPGDKGPDKIVTHCRSSSTDSGGKIDYDVIRIIA